MDEDLKTFVDLVTRMRRSQRDYFRTRRGDHLEASKLLEKLVDQAIRELGNRQPSLFGKEPSR